MKSNRSLNCYLCLNTIPIMKQQKMIIWDPFINKFKMTLQTKSQKILCKQTSQIQWVSSHLKVLRRILRRKLESRHLEVERFWLDVLMKIYSTVKTLMVTFTSMECYGLKGGFTMVRKSRALNIWKTVISTKERTRTNFLTTKVAMQSTNMQMENTL